MAYKTEAEWVAAQPDLTKIADPMTRNNALESWQNQRPGYVDPMNSKSFYDYNMALNAADRVKAQAEIDEAKARGVDLLNPEGGFFKNGLADSTAIRLRSMLSGIHNSDDQAGAATFYGLTPENYQNVLSGDMTRPMGVNQAVYGAELLSPLERLAAETARGQGFSTMSPKTLALAQANPDVFNAASQRYQNYFASTYPGTLEYESVLSGPMQFSSAGVKYPEIKDTVSMYILDRRTGQYVKNPNYRGIKKAADGGLMSMANQMASKGRGPDSMLIHMSPSEVQGLQALAMKHGGSLTINPETGLPEAGFLDKLLPTIIGAGLSFIPGVGPLMAAGIVGGIQTVRTGDIGKGLAAGLGAYGGAGLAAGLTTAGAETLNTAAGQSYLSNYAPPGVLEGAGAGLSADMAYNLADAGITTAGTEGMNAAQLAAVEKAANATPFDRLSAGASQAVSSPKAAGAFLKDNTKNLMMAFGPAILAGANVQAKGPQTITKPGMIRPYSFDPYGGTYTAGTPYEAQAKKAAGGGLMGMDDGGYGPGQLDFTQRSEPVIRMADGGIAHFAAGGDYRSLTKDSSADDIASAYKQFTTASGGDTAANQQAAINYLTNLGIGQDKIGQAYGTYQASPTYTDYTKQNALDYLTTNKDINIAEKTKELNANPFLVNQVISEIGAGYLDPTQTTAGSGAQKYYDAYTNRGITADELYSANLALNPKYDVFGETGTAGLNALKRAFDVAKQFDTYEYDKAPGTQLQKDVAALIQYDAGKFGGDRMQQIKDIARETGLSLDETTRRYDAARAAMKPLTPITPLPVSPVVPAGPKTTTPITYNTAGTNPPTPIESVLGLPPGVSGAGITTVNPGGTITTRPDIPGIGDGFTGIKQVRDTYEEGGGSLGVNKNLFVPKTQDELFARYKNTGGSKAAFDYLMGKTPYSPTPYTPTGEIMKPYLESVGRAPVNLKTKRYIYDPEARIYKENPAYIKPSYVLAGEKAAALTDPENPPTAKAGEGKKWVWSNEAKKWEVKPINAVADTPVTGQNDGGGGGDGGANGGLMSMARGGMSQQFDLGGYSDGGRLLRGPGDGVSDSIPATIGNKRPARLADGEFVVPARIVSELGNGSTEAGARKLYAMMDRVQAARRGTVGKGRVAKNSRSDKYLPA